MSEQKQTFPIGAARLGGHYVDRTTISIGAEGIARLGFGVDQPDGTVQWLVTVAMTNANLESLYTALGQLMMQAAALPPGTKPS